MMFAHKPSFHLCVSLFKGLVVLALLFGSALNVVPAGASASSTLVVSTGVDEQITNGLCSLREAIVNANVDLQSWADCPSGLGNDTILFADGITTITLGSMLPQITDTDGLLINGGDDVTISGNNSVQVIYVTTTGVLTLQNITVANGKAIGGGGVYSLGALAIVKSTFSGNHATGSGGGLLINLGGTAIVRDSTFSANGAVEDGGGIDNFGTITIVNSTFSNNSANSGGGLMNNSGTAAITNATFSGNSAAYGAGISMWNGGAALPVTSISNTILANGLTGEDCLNGFGAYPLSGSNNIIEVTTNCASIATLTGDPGLGALSGSPAYYLLNSGSPAIDAGSDSVCAAWPVSAGSQNGVPRPQGAHCDIGSYELPPKMVLRSLGPQDGWVLESSETGSVGGTLDATATTFNLGDDASNRQYRVILHFNTASLPDTAVIVNATLMIKKQGLVGTNPFGTHGALRAYLRKPSFGTSALQLTDFQAVPSSPLAASFGATPAGGWYSAVLNDAARVLINRTGTTQFRLRFAKDDNNDHGADYMKFFSGNAAAGNRPVLLIDYYLPP